MAFTSEQYQKTIDRLFLMLELAAAIQLESHKVTSGKEATVDADSESGMRGIPATLDKLCNTLRYELGNQLVGLYNADQKPGEPVEAVLAWAKKRQ